MGLQSDSGSREGQAQEVWADAVMALALLAIDPRGLGGANVRAPAGVVRDAWLEAFRARLPEGEPVRRVPSHVSEQRLIGGLDLSATLAAGQAVVERGLLASGDGGVLILAMAERVTSAVASQLCGALDTGVVALERDGLSAVQVARFGLIALDEGINDDERVPQAVLDRLAFLVDLSAVGHRDMDALVAGVGAVRVARARLAGVTIGDELLDALVTTAFALGVDSSRAALFAVRAARAAAALAGRTVVEADDAALAARLVLSSRATRLPTQAEPEEEPEEQSQPDEPEPQSQPETAEQPDASPPEPPEQDTAEKLPPKEQDPQQLEDMLLEAAKAAIPAGVLAQLQQAGRILNKSRSQGRVGQERKSSQGGRPTGVLRGDPRRAARLNVVETLRAAAPWQVVRRRERAAMGQAEPATGKRQRIEVRSADFHVTRHKQKSETATIFVVDASGSSALNRLAEAKGAVELLLADCYVRRDQVAVIAFRGTKADVLLPPTRSLVRAKRSLAGLPGGGPTPMATALDAAAALADAVRRKGQMPTVILLTDGRANVSRAGLPGRAQAELDAIQSARQFRALGLTALLIDTSPKPQPAAERLAGEMDALYLPLPYADAAKLSKAVRATREPG